MNRNQICWDRVNLKYPVRKFPETCDSSQTIGHYSSYKPEILLKQKEPEDIQVFEYSHDHSINKHLNKSQSNVDFGRKKSEVTRFNKNNSCRENQYIYPHGKQLYLGFPTTYNHGVTEMRDKFTKPTQSSRLVTDKDQYKNTEYFPENKLVEPSWHTEIPPMDTTYDGYLKYLDPYLTTSRLHHRPFTSDQTKRQSASKDIVTYHTLSNVPWVRSPKPNVDNWWLSRGCPRPMYDRQTFKQHCREIRVHKSPLSVSFRTETRDNYKRPEASIGFRSFDIEDGIKAVYHRATSALPTRKYQEDISVLQNYSTENQYYGSGKPLCTILDPYVEKNRRIK